MKKVRYLFSALTWLGILSLPLPAAITYVDAGSGNTPNNGWNYRTTLGNSSDVYEGIGSGALELATTITGLTPGAQYDID